LFRAPSACGSIMMTDDRRQQHRGEPMRSPDRAGHGVLEPAVVLLPITGATGKVRSQTAGIATDELWAGSGERTSATRELSTTAAQIYRAMPMFRGTNAMIL
jgi:hypothetical protein